MLSKLLKWKNIENPKQYTGITLKGDSSMSDTTLLKVFWQRFFSWKECTILKVPEGIGKYKVGYIPFKGPARYLDISYQEPMFWVTHGKEDCTFVAFDEGGNEITLTEVKRTKTNDKELSHIPAF